MLMKCLISHIPSFKFIIQVSTIIQLRLQNYWNSYRRFHAMLSCKVNTPRRFVYLFSERKRKKIDIYNTEMKYSICSFFLKKLLYREVQKRWRQSNCKIRNLM